METLKKSQRPTPINKELFGFFATQESNLNDPYFYRIDAVYDWEKTNPLGFQLPRKFTTNISDEKSLGLVLRTLPEGHALFRLGWWINWRETAAWIHSNRSDEKLVISRIAKDKLRSIPGIKICEDEMLPNRAILSYTIEKLTSSNSNFSDTFIPYELTDYFLADFHWHSASPILLPPATPIDHPRTISIDFLATFLILKSLATGAQNIVDLIQEYNSSALEYSVYVRKALASSGIECGSTSRHELLLVLLKYSGKSSPFSSLEPSPYRISKSLLSIVCYECKQNHRPWHEGEAELKRRDNLRGIHKIIWYLRDKGLLKMNPERNVRDTAPRFP